MMKQNSPIIEHESFNDSIDNAFQSNGWCCLGHPCFGPNRANDEETKGLLGDERETWFRERLRVAKEVSEVLARPKWKFIRKISKYISRRRMRKGQFRYDPQSYALNFEDGGIVSNTLRPPVPESCDPEWRSLMERCWSPEPSERPNFTEIANELRTMASKIPTKAQNQQQTPSSQPQTKS